MKLLDLIRDNLSQICAVTEKNIKMSMRFKLNLIFSYFYPLLGIIMPMIILKQFLSNNISFAPWNETNYFVFIFVAYNIGLMTKLIDSFHSEFILEKYWRTIEALMIAPFRTYNLLFGIVFSTTITIIIPFSIFLILCYIYYPISIITLLFVIFIYLSIALVFSGIGLFLGSLAISKENYLNIFKFFTMLLIWGSCILFPYQLFPAPLQQIINLNPLYYIFDFLRLTWIEDDVILSIQSHWFNFMILIILCIITPILSVYIFNFIFKKYGIVGY